MSRKVLQKKQKVAEYFTQRLLKSKAGKDVTGVILFGSVVKGEADSFSDIDLMIFAKKPKRVAKLADELSYDILLEQGEPIEPHVYPASDRTAPRSYFVKLATKTGQPIYLSQ